MKNTLYLLLLFVFAVLPLSTNAHAPDQTYIYLRVNKASIDGRFEITTDDLNKALGLNLQRGLTIEEVNPYLPQIKKYFLERSGFSFNGQEYKISFMETDIYVIDDLGDFVRFHFNLDGITEIPEALNVNYNVLIDKDSKHQGMLVVEYNWKAGIIDNESMVSLIFSRLIGTQQELDLTEGSVFKGFMMMIWMGIWHIFIGLDHILFLLALVLPAVIYRIKNEVEEVTASPAMEAHYSGIPLPLPRSVADVRPVKSFKPALIYVLVIVSFFTLAHCITLSLAALEIIVLPSRLVESIIAISIALAALHNIRPLFKRDWIIAFVFGLFHGFGFASVLADLGLSGDYVTYSLLGFNIGVELGQIAIICAIFPILYLIRRSKAYPAILVYGSAILIFISLYWFIERGFDVDLPLGAWIYKILSFIGL